MTRWVARAFALIGIGWLVFRWLTQPQLIDDASLPAHQANLDNGADMFHAGACASCHSVPDQGDDSSLGGGLELVTDFGVFRAPNISPDPETGIGNWTETDFINAMRHGVSPDGRHYYPAFPYASYSRMTESDMRDLKAYLDTLPPVSNAVAGPELGFPWNIRRGVGLWKRRYLDPSPVIETEPGNDQLARGRYLVEGPGHCAECHTARDFGGGLIRSRWLAGAPNPDGEGRIPNITPHEDGLAEWSEADLAYYFESGLTPDYDTSGGSMVEVQENLSNLSKEDLRAIAAYLKAIPALPDAPATGD